MTHDITGTFTCDMPDCDSTYSYGRQWFSARYPRDVPDGWSFIMDDLNYKQFICNLHEIHIRTEADVTQVLTHGHLST